MLSQMTLPGRVALSHGVSSPAISSVSHRLMSVLFNYNLEAMSVPLCLFWVWSDIVNTVVWMLWIFWTQTGTADQNIHTEYALSTQYWQTKNPHKKINIKIKSMMFYWAQSHWIIKPVCDILKWASYFIIDWQIVTILTQSLTFCRTCRPKSCFWPFSHFIHSDSAPHAVNI